MLGAAAIGCAVASAAVPLSAASASASLQPGGPIYFVGSPGTSAPPATLGNPGSMLYSMLPFGPDGRTPGDTVTSVTGPLESLTPAGTRPTGTVRFSSPLTHCKVGGCWATWSHGYAGDVYTTASQSVRLSLPVTNAFYFYAEPDQFATLTITAVTKSGTTSGPISVNGRAGARYFGFYTTGTSPLASITVTTTDPTGFALGEFGIAAPYQFVVPVSSVLSPYLLEQTDPIGVQADIQVAVGTPYYAVTAGIVSHTASVACGAGTVLLGADGVRYTYCHTLAWLVPSGAHVPAGTALGFVGQSVIPPSGDLAFQVAYPSSPRPTLRCPQTMLADLYYNSAKGNTLPVPNPRLLPPGSMICPG